MYFIITGILLAMIIRIDVSFAAPETGMDGLIHVISIIDKQLVHAEYYSAFMH